MAAPDVIVALTGFENYYANSSQQPHAMHTWDHLKARSGFGYFRMFRTASGSSTVFNFSAITTPTAGEGLLRTRFFVRQMTAFSTAKALFDMRVGNASAGKAGVVMQPDGRIYAFFADAGGIDIGTTTVQACPLGDWDGWVQIDLTITLTEGGASDVVFVSAVITFPDGNQETITKTATENLGTLTFSTPSWAGGTVTGLTNNGTWECHFDDVWLAYATGANRASVPAFPGGTRIARCSITGPGSEQTFTGDWTLVHKNFGTSTETRQQGVLAAGLRTTFTHETAAQMGFPGGTCYGIQLMQEAASSGNQVPLKFRVGGATVDRGITMDSTIRHDYWYCDFTERDAATFDALEWGSETTNAAGTLSLYAMTAEVLHDGLPHPPIHYNPGAGFRHTFIKYTGDGTDHKAVTGVGFRPTFVQIWPLGGNGDTVSRYVGVPFSQPTESGDNIRTLDADGFSVGLTVPNCNVNAAEYIALCVRDDGLMEDGLLRFRFWAAAISSTDDTQLMPDTYHPFQFRLAFFVPDLNASSQATYVQTQDMGTLDPAIDTTTAPADVGLALLANGVQYTGPITSLQTTGWGLMFGWADHADIDPLIQVGEIPANASDVVQPVTGFASAIYLVIGRGNKATNSSHLRWDEPAVFTGTTDARWVSGTVGQTGGFLALGDADFTVDGGGGMLTGSAECWWAAFSGGLFELLPADEITELQVGDIGLIWIEAYLPD